MTCKCFQIKPSKADIWLFPIPQEMTWNRGFGHASPPMMLQVFAATPVSVSSWLASFPAAASAVLPPDSSSRLRTQHKRSQRWGAWRRHVWGVSVSHRRCWGWWTRSPSLCSDAAPPERRAPPLPLHGQSEGTHQWNSYIHLAEAVKQTWRLTFLDFSSFLWVWGDDSKSFVTETEIEVLISLCMFGAFL